MASVVDSRDNNNGGEVVPQYLSTLLADLETLTPLRPHPASADSGPSTPTSSLISMPPQTCFTTPQTLASAPFLTGAHQQHPHEAVGMTSIASSTPRPASSSSSASSTSGVASSTSPPPPSTTLAPVSHVGVVGTTSGANGITSGVFDSIAATTGVSLADCVTTDSTLIMLSDILSSPSHT